MLYCCQYPYMNVNNNTKSTITEREGEYPTSLRACVTTLYGGHDLCNDIHKLEASFLDVCGHVAKPHVLQMQVDAAAM